MPIEITMPKLSDTMEEGTILQWRIKEGDKVNKGQVIAEVETDKAAMEMEAFEAGVVGSLKVEEGATVPVGTVIAVFDGEGTEKKAEEKKAEEKKAEEKKAEEK
jgi:pyruvate dehydrogenase E2 component (dihydrolipoamide acetyltransferase)